MSGLDQATDELLNDNSRTITPTAVLSQALLMMVVSVVTVFAFNILRPKNKIIYEPKVKYHVGNKPPPRISDSIFGWLPPLIHTKEPELVDKIGLDAVVFLRFLRLLRTFFSLVAILTCAVLIPINVTYNLKNVKPKDRDALSMLTLRDVGGNILFVHVVATYVITIVLCWLVYINWAAIVRLRKQWYRSPEYRDSFYARTLAVTHVPHKLQTDEGLRNIFDSVRMPYPTTSVHIGRKVGRLPELIEYHNDTVREFEQILVKYLRGGKIGKKRPKIRIGGTCGLGGTKKDAIDFYTAKLKRTEAAIEEYRNQIDTRKAENYGFASLAAVPYAHIAARQLDGKKPRGATIALAPNPKDIIWENMNKSDSEIASKKMMGFVWLAFVCFLNTVPLLVISLLANLNSLTAYVPFLQKWSDASPTSFAVISGVLPPAVSAAFGFVLPIIMRKLTKFMGALTHSRLDRAVIARYFAFLVISQLVIFTLLGVIINSVQQIVKQIGHKSFQQIIDNLHTLPDTINSTYINQASYWLTFFPLRGFLVLFDLAQIINLLWIPIKTRLFGRTPRDIREWTQPLDFEYAIYYSNILFMASVGLVFAPLAPLVPLTAAIVFWMSSWVYKYQLMFVFVTRVETGGRLWNVAVNRLLFCVSIMQTLMLLTIGLQYGWKSFTWISAIPPVLIVMGFKVYINRAFLEDFNYYRPTEDEVRDAKIHSERADHKGNRLEKRFGHPALHTDLFTPMLHAKMMPLLGQVYSGKISSEQAKLDEYGGQSMQAQVVPGGIRIAAIDQRDLEYDPMQYRRDRGEQDWDTKSMASTNILMDDGATSLHHAKSTFYARGGASTPVPVPTLPGVAPGAYNRYLAQGAPSEIELSRMDTSEEPLLAPRNGPGYYQDMSRNPSTVSIPISSYHQQYQEGDRQAPVHRPQHTSGTFQPGYFDRAPTASPGPTPVGEYPPSYRAYTPSPTGTPYHQQQSSMGGGPVNRVGTPTQHHVQQSSMGGGPVNRVGTPTHHHPQQGSYGSGGGPVNMAGRGTWRG